jgi:hypothetical protein
MTEANMRSFTRRAVWLAFWLVALSSAASSDCLEDPRTVALDGANVVQLRSYLCRSGQGRDEVQFRAEFHRLSDVAASALVAKRVSQQLSRTLGSPRIVENEVLRTYSDLLQRFGTTIDPHDTYPRYDLESAIGGTASTADVVPGETVRALIGGDPSDEFFYPAIEESAALSKKSIPPNLRYYHTIRCRDHDNAKDIGDVAVCNKYGRDSVSMIFWRSMRQEDFANYSRRLSAYIARHRDYGGPTEIPRELTLANHLGGASWPEDFLILIGLPGEEGCDAGFYFQMRVALLDVLLIENLTSQPFSIEDLFGARTHESRLRAPASTSGLANVTSELGTSIGRLAPNERVILPLRILFAPNPSVKDVFAYRQTSSQIYKRIGAKGFGGNIAGYGAPSFKSYAYGPELVVNGIRVNGSRVDLMRPSANFLQLTMRTDKGSCPYLLSQDRTDATWVEHGKILHHAPNRERQYTEVKAFPGFKSRFRIEEREPEIAFIDQMELVVLLTDGTTVQLQPDHPKLAARDGHYVRLLWGDKVEVEFALPEGVAEDEVKETHLSVTGYYQTDFPFRAPSVAGQGIDLRGRSSGALSRTNESRGGSQTLYSPRQP